ncbi:hypothetical protein [Microcystis phage Me-ZS1]|nr:hypothetical protein [Microcystis phage Me-ZS1]
MYGNEENRTAYDNALTNYNEAFQVFHNLRSRFRLGFVPAEEFLAAKRDFAKAQAEMDLAETLFTSHVFTN